MLFNIILSNYPEEILKRIIPLEWDNFLILKLSQIEEVLSTYDCTDDNINIYSIDKIFYYSKNYHNQILNYSDSLWKIFNDKYYMRKNLSSASDILSKISNLQSIQWNDNNSVKLIAKPIWGFSKQNNNLFMLKNNELFNNNDNINYIFEEYIDNNYPKICVIGCIYDKKIDILSIWDNIYYDNYPFIFKTVNYPSIYSNNKHIINKYTTTLNELIQKTDCNNLIIEIEMYLINDQVKIMKIKPFIRFEYLPILSITGYNVFKILENLNKKQKPIKTEKIGYGICRYNIGRAKKKKKSKILR